MCRGAADTNQFILDEAYFFKTQGEGTYRTTHVFRIDATSSSKFQFNLIGSH